MNKRKRRIFYFFAIPISSLGLAFLFTRISLTTIKCPPRVLDCYAGRTVGGWPLEYMKFSGGAVGFFKLDYISFLFNIMFFFISTATVLIFLTIIVENILKMKNGSK